MLLFASHVFFIFMSFLLFYCQLLVALELPIEAGYSVYSLEGSLVTFLEKKQFIEVLL